MSANTIASYAAQTAAAAAATAAATANGNSAGSANSSLALTQNDFLQLLVTQMQHQDPTQPTNPSQFINEFSALSEVSGISSMSNSMGNLSNSMSSAQILNGTNLIGHTVIASGDTAALAAGGGTVTGAVNAPAGTTTLTVQVDDSSGQLVRTFSVPAQSGVTPFTWDGTTNSGSAAPAGTYKFTVTANANGTQSSVTPELAYKVNSVTLDPTTNSLTLNTDGGSVPLSSVNQVM